MINLVRKILSSKILQASIKIKALLKQTQEMEMETNKIKFKALTLIQMKEKTIYFLIHSKTQNNLPINKDRRKSKCPPNKIWFNTA